MERLAYSLLGIAAFCWLLVVLDIVPVGGLGLSALAGATGVILLIIKVIVERLRNKEDDHYSKTVKR